MTVSSRTPEGLPHRCPVCGKVAAIEPSSPGGDSTCPSCGHLLWWLRDQFASKLRIDPNVVHLAATIDELGIDSLDIVEFVMEVEEELGVELPQEEVERMRTVADLVRLIKRLREKGAA